MEDSQVVETRGSWEKRRDIGGSIFYCCLSEEGLPEPFRCATGRRDRWVPRTLNPKLSACEPSSTRPCRKRNGSHAHTSGGDFPLSALIKNSLPPVLDHLLGSFAPGAVRRPRPCMDPQCLPPFPSTIRKTQRMNTVNTTATDDNATIAAAAAAAQTPITTTITAFISWDPPECWDVSDSSALALLDAAGADGSSLGGGSSASGAGGGGGDNNADGLVTEHLSE